MPPALLRVFDLGLVFTLIGSHHVVRVCARLTKDDCFEAGAAPPRLENCGLQMWKGDKEVETERERMDEGGGEGDEKKKRAVLIANGIPHPHLQEK